MTTFEHSTDYALIRSILVEPRCWRQMGYSVPDQSKFTVRALSGLEYVLARDETGAALAVFVLVDPEWKAQVHFCFRPEAWGRTEEIAREFLAWIWAHSYFEELIGPVPDHNRLALRLARAVGFKEYAREGRMTLLRIERPR